MRSLSSAGYSGMPLPMACGYPAWPARTPGRRCRERDPKKMASRSGLKTRLKWLMALMFAALFLAFSLSLMGLSVYYLVLAFEDDDIISGIIRSINIAFISLATFE